jgi:hypothetical protein
MLPVSFVTWVNHLSWILTPPIVVETNSYIFLSKNNHSPKNGIIVIGLVFKSFPTHVGGRLLDTGFNNSRDFCDMG